MWCYELNYTSTNLNVKKYVCVCVCELFFIWIKKKRAKPLGRVRLHGQMRYGYTEIGVNDNAVF